MGRSLKSSQIRIGLLGASRIAPRAIIEPALSRSDVAVTHVAARDELHASWFARVHGLQSVASYAELLAIDELDLIYVSLPPSHHAQWAIAALQAGKAVLCEKPFSVSSLEARAMVEAGRRARRPLLEAYHYRHHAAFREVERIVDRGELGHLHRASATFCLDLTDKPRDFRWRSDLGGGALADLGCYCVHALRTLMRSEPTNCNAIQTMRHGVDAEFQAECRFASVKATIACSMIAAHQEARLCIVGDRQSLMLENYVAPQVGHRLKLFEGNTLLDVRTIPGKSSYAEQLDHVISVLNRGIAPATGGRDAIATMVALETIRRAATATGR